MRRRACASSRAPQTLSVKAARLDALNQELELIHADEEAYNAYQACERQLKLLELRKPIAQRNALEGELKVAVDACEAAVKDMEVRRRRRARAGGVVPACLPCLPRGLPANLRHVAPTARLPTRIAGGDGAAGAVGGGV